MQLLIPKSLKNAVTEEPDRFLKYLDLDKIARSKDPYKEFERQLRKEFGGTTSGVQMWKYIKNSYKLKNAMWKGNALQRKLDDDYQGSFKRAKHKELYPKFRSPVSPKIDTTERVVNKTVKAPGYVRKVAGKVLNVSSYSRTKPRNFSSAEVDFLQRRIGESPKQTRMAFNRTFKTNKTYSSIVTKMSRLRAK